MRNKLALKTNRTENVIIKKFASEEGVMQTLDVVAVCCHGKLRDVKVYLQALVVPIICSPLENQQLNLIKESCSYLDNLPLAENHISGEEPMIINLLVGLDYYYSLITGKIIKGMPFKPVTANSPADIYVKFKQDIEHDGTRYIVKLPFKPHGEPLIIINCVKNDWRI